MNKFNFFCHLNSENQSIAIRLTYKSQIKDTKIGKVVTFLGMDETSEIALVSFGKYGTQIHSLWEVNNILHILRSLFIFLRISLLEQ